MAYKVLDAGRKPLEELNSTVGNWSVSCSAVYKATLSPCSFINFPLLQFSTLTTHMWRFCGTTPWTGHLKIKRYFHFLPHFWLSIILMLKFHGAAPFTVPLIQQAGQQTPIQSRWAPRPASLPILVFATAFRIQSCLKPPEYSNTFVNQES